MTSPGEIVYNGARVIIAGTRTAQHQHVLEAIESSPFKIRSVLSGGAPGADYNGEMWARLNDVPLEVYPANWTLYGKAAGPIRNRKMAENADALIAVWDGKSRGTQSMINIATELKLQVYVYEYAPAFDAMLEDL